MEKLGHYVDSKGAGGHYLYWGGIFVLMCLPILSIGDNIGMYFDSILPDYAATQLLNPQEYQEKWFAAYPYLCQIYHGTVGVWISAIGILLTGTTGVVQHHVTNVLLEFTALLLMDRVLDGYRVSGGLRKGIIVLLALAPTVTTVAMTQYYIELPGTNCMLGSVLVYHAAEKSNSVMKQKLLLFVTFFLCGLAFYSYFNFLFWIAGFACYEMLDREIKINIRTKLLISGYGCLAGSVFYFAGYAQIAQNYAGAAANAGIPIFVWLLIWMFCGGMLWLLLRGKDRMVCFCTGVFVLVVAAAAARYSSIVLSYARTLSVGGYYSAGLTKRIGIVFECLFSAVTGVSAEKLILQEQVTEYWNLAVILFCVIQVTYVSLACWNRAIKNRVSVCLMMEVIYLLCCIPFATRMQTQHVVPLIFWTFILVGMELQYIIDFIAMRVDRSAPFGRKLFAAVIAVIVAIFAVCGVIFGINRYRVTDRILETGGRGYYTSQVNKLAESALEKKREGEKEVYLFPEWGFMSEFDYLTGNKVAFSSDCSAASVSEFLRRGFTVNIVYWDGEKTDEYRMTANENGEKELVYFYDYNHEIVFYNLRILGDQKG